MGQHETDRYEILRALATAGVQSDKMTEAGQAALEQAAALIGLDAAALYLWSERREIGLHLTCAAAESSAARLAEIESDLFEALRRERALVSGYLTFDDDPPLHSFTLPLRHGKKIFGAVIGLQQGERTTVTEDAFLDALAATLALNAIAAGQGGSLPQDLIDKERSEAVSETAVTVNHEINNPLTAILGNVQLLLLHRDDLDDELRGKLHVIEEAASRIKEVTQRLLSLTSARSTDYASGTRMIDLSDPEEPDSLTEE